MYKCDICGEEFQSIHKKANHCRWKHQSSEIHSQYLNKLHDIKMNSYDIKLGKITNYSVQCHNCGVQFEVKLRATKFIADKKYFCSRACSNKRVINDDVRKKISMSVSRTLKIKGELNKKIESNKIECNCVNCNKVFFKLKQSNKICCSRLCISQHYLTLQPIKNQYYILAQFKFKINSYPNEFDFKLISSLGWYKPSNHGNNPNGVSRDHMISIHDGFKYNIHPLLLAHPANCKLISHKLNFNVKNKNSSITIEQLLIRIKIWDNKYGKYYSNNIPMYWK